MQLAVRANYTPHTLGHASNYLEYFRDRQEQRILAEHLGASDSGRILDVVCGDGHRHDQYTDTVDLSRTQMPAEADRPAKDRSLRTPFAANTFRAIIGLRLGDHLTATDLEDFLWEASRVGQPGTRVVLTVPAADLEDCRGTRWREVAVVGVDLLPIGRLPKWLHRTASLLNDRLCRTGLRRFARSRVFVLELVG